MALDVNGMEGPGSPYTLTWPPSESYAAMRTVINAVDPVRQLLASGTIRFIVSGVEQAVDYVGQKSRLDQNLIWYFSPMRLATAAAPRVVSAAPVVATPVPVWVPKSPVTTLDARHLAMHLLLKGGTAMRGSSLELHLFTACPSGSPASVAITDFTKLVSLRSPGYAPIVIQPADVTVADGVVSIPARVTSVKATGDWSGNAVSGFVLLSTGSPAKVIMYQETAPWNPKNGESYVVTLQFSISG